MPVMLGAAQGGKGSSDQVARLSAEVNRLRKELAAVRGQVTGEGARGSLLGWITMALAACGTLLGLIAMFRG